ncbi:MAG: hypothetical protein QXZ41_07485, partial [Ignisphaera sp.]
QGYRGISIMGFFAGFAETFGVLEVYVALESFVKTFHLRLREYVPPCFQYCFKLFKEFILPL